MTPREVSTLVPWRRVLEEGGADPGRDSRTQCQLHGGDNPTSFSYSERTGTAHCFACGWSGDKLAFLQAALGVDFKTALARLAELAGVKLDGYRNPSSTELPRAKARKTALEVTRNTYETWAFWKLQELCDEHIELLADREVAESVYRAVQQHPEWFEEKEKNWWESELARIYHRLPVLEYQLDLLTFREHEAEKFTWWSQEEEAGRSV